MFIKDLCCVRDPAGKLQIRKTHPCLPGVYLLVGRMGHPSIYSVIYFFNDPRLPPECPILLGPEDAVQGLDDSQLAGEAVSEPTVKSSVFWMAAQGPTGRWRTRVLHYRLGNPVLVPLCPATIQTVSQYCGFLLTGHDQSTCVPVTFYNERCKK